jgi:hypothetical protein
MVTVLAVEGTVVLLEAGCAAAGKDCLFDVEMVVVTAGDKLLMKQAF